MVNVCKREEGDMSQHYTSLHSSQVTSMMRVYTHRHTIWVYLPVPCKYPNLNPIQHRDALEI